MSLNDQKITLYRYRSIGEKVNAGIEFIRINSKALLRLALYALLPVAMLHAFVLYGVYNLDSGFSLEEWTTTFLPYGVAFFIAGIFVVTFTLTLVKEYQDGGSARLSTMTMGELYLGMLRVSWRVVLAMLFDAVVGGVVAMIAVGLVLVIVGIPIVPMATAMTLGFLAMMPVVYVLYRDGRVSFFGAIAKWWSFSWKQGLRLMGLVFMLVFVLILLQSVVDLPFYLVISSFDELVLATPGQSASGMDILLSFVLYLWNVLRCFYCYLTFVFGLMVIVYHYGSVADYEEDASLRVDIRKFDEL